MAKKIPLRRCVISGERLPKKELLRVVKTPEGEVKIDLTGKLNGHGAYLKKDAAVFAQARKSRVLNRHLETEVPEAIYDQLEEMLK